MSAHKPGRFHDSFLKVPQKLAFFIGKCARRGLDPEKSITFHWLQADVHASFNTGVHKFLFYVGGQN
jgi:hypothetical protein